MEIWLSTKDRKEFFKFPYLNTENINFSFPLNVQEFETSSGKTLTLIGEEGLREIKISSFFPSKKYRWLPYNVFLAPVCLKFIATHRKDVLTVTVVSVEKIFTMKCYISDFEYTKKTNKDIDYSITLKEYINK